MDKRATALLNKVHLSPLTTGLALVRLSFRGFDEAGVCLIEKKLSPKPPGVVLIPTAQIVIQKRSDRGVGKGFEFGSYP